ncbi:MAG: DUF1616 domain-containing protein [Euryarchaeota archaeon]|nr:DUF1616 domain-containing protein [Euryarchaeota archaeon]
MRKGSKTKLPSDLLAVLALMVLTVFFVLVPSFEKTAFRTILGLPVVLFLPGYALIAALFPRKNDLDAIERIALSFGLSIAVVPLIGLVLNFTPWGIRLLPIIISLTLFIFIMVFIAHSRRLQIQENEKFEVNFKKLYDSIKAEAFSKPENRTDRILTIVLLISIILAILMVVYVIVTPKQGEKFTEFYLLGPGGKAEGYPTNLTTGKTGSVIVGVVNHEYATMNYTLRVKIKEELLNEQHIQVEHNQTWEKPVNFTPLSQGSSLKLEFLLYPKFPTQKFKPLASSPVPSRI